MFKMRKLLPFLEWFPLRRGALQADLIAGLTVALLAIPQSLACAQLAGVPMQYGLYGALLPTAIGALFGSSPILSTGPVQITALLTGASVALLAPSGSIQFVHYVVMLALISGAFQVAFGVVRMGVLLNFISQPVLAGFINAAAIIIAMSQLPTMLGVAVTHSPHLLLDVWTVLSHPTSISQVSVFFAVSAIVVLTLLRKAAPRLPGMLITVALLTAVSQGIGYERLGGSIVGEFAAGLPSIELPALDWSTLTALLPASFIIALISFMEATSSCKVIAIKTRTPWHENRELIGQGLAKIAASLTNAMPVSGSFSRSALNLAAGAKTGMSSLFCAGFVFIALLFLTPLLHALPQAVLSAVIVVSVFNVVDIASLRRAWRAGADDGIAALATFVTTLIFAPNIQIGVISGILLSLALLLYRLMRPRVAVLGLHEDGTLRDARRLNLPYLHEQLGAIRFDGSLIFVNVSYFEDAVLQLARERPHIKYLLVAAGGVNTIDASGIEALGRLAQRLSDSGITLCLSGVKQQVLAVMEKTGLTGTVGPQNIFATDIIGLNALLQRLGAAPATPASAVTPLLH
jgi:SulP family sulfate permease